MKKLMQISALLLLCHSLSAQEMVVDTLNFDKMGASSPTELFSGKVSGVKVSATDGGVNAAVNTTIRGINSLRTVSSPLWIVDGTVLTSSQSTNLNAFWQDKYQDQSYTPETNPLAFLNPYDIESIEILKDATATAIYGSQGANGVIIIKTKLPSENKNKLEINSNVGIGNGGRVSHNHNLSFAGKTSNNAYRISAFIRSKQGIAAKEKDFNGGLSINFDAKTNKTVWFGLKSNLGIGRTSSLSGTNWFGSESAMAWYRNGGLNQAYNNDYDDNGKDYRAVNSVYLRINFLRNLHWTTDFGADYDNNTRYIWYGNGTALGKEKNGAAAIVNSTCLEYKVSTKLDYDVFIAKDHHLQALAGAEVSGSKDRFNTMNGCDFFSHELRAEGLSYNGDNVIIHKFDHNISRLGFFGKVSYDFKSIAGIDASLRADKTHRYDDGRFTLYPAAEAWFDVHKLFSDTKGVSALKLNAGYGKSGREYYIPVTEFGIAAPGLSTVLIQEDVQTLFEGLSRVMSSEWHAGFSAGFISDRIRLSAKYYEKVSQDAFSAYCFGKPIIGTIRWQKSGRNDFAAFNSSFRNRGIEAELGATILKSKDFDWTASANVAFQSNQILSIAEEDRYSSSVSDGIVSNYNEVGYAANAILGYKTDANGQFIDQTADGIIGPEDRVIIGRSAPTVFGGLNTSFRWRGLDIYLSFDGAAGAQLLNMNRMLTDGESTISDKYIENADYLRLSRAGVSYRFDFNTRWIKSLKVSLCGNNLFTASRYSGFNPDVDSYAKLARTRGLDYASFPILKSGILGVSIIF